MITIQGYETGEAIYEGENTVVYRAIQKKDGKPVIIKLLKSENPKQQEIFKFIQEFETARDLPVDGIVKPFNLEPYRNGYILVSEDFGGISLAKFLKQRELTLSQFLRLAISLANTLGNIHKHHVIHKDIKPSNIIIDPISFESKLTDFGISTKLSQEKTRYNPTNVLEGTLLYISPEQTGRMNRSVDYRTDLYSLGVSFYEILTGKQPFTSDDPMELVHSHIAKQPVPPVVLRNSIPKIISDIVLKLMEKTAEERYQSAFGLKADLEKCKNLLDLSENELEISSFELGEEDYSGRFQAIQKLYGREEETEKLLSAFDRISVGQTELFLVSGYSGVGKSALIHEVHKPITERKGYFISGKFDQYQRNVPYYAINQAFKDLCNHWILESEEVVIEWKKKIIAATGDNAQVLIDIIPDLELILGKQPEIPVLGPQETQNRFNLQFQNFIKAISKKEHPLVIFIDDLQWADSGSLALLKTILSDSSLDRETSLLVLGAYRDNEVDLTHPFILTVDEIKKTGLTVESIELQPLTQTDVQNLISDTLNSKLEESNSLSELVYQKTNGNAFFVNEFLKTLYEEELVLFDFTLKKWIWDIDKIKTQNVTSNVVELMSQKIAKLPDDTQEILELAACIGNKFNLRILSIIHEISIQQVLENIWKAVEEGLIFPLDNHYKLIHRNSEATSEIHSEFQFLHDRLQEAAYAMMDLKKKKEVHLKIGRLILSNTKESEIEERIFDIVNQYNHSEALITNKEEKIKFAELNFRAGKKAKASTAYESACRFLELADTALKESGWTENYDLYLSVQSELCEANYLNLNFDKSDFFFERVVDHAHSVLDKTPVYETKIRSLIARQHLLEAIHTAAEIVSKLGVYFPKKANKINVVVGLLKTKFLVARKGYDYPLSAPPMLDPGKIAVMRILSNIASTTYQTNFELFAVLVFTMTSLSYQYGNVNATAYALDLYAVAHAGVLHDYDNALKYSNLAIELLDRLDAKDVRCKTLGIASNFSMHWKLHMKETYPGLLAGARAGLETGDFEYYGYCVSFYIINGFFSTLNLNLLEEDSKKYHISLENLKQDIPLYIIKIWGQLIINLKGDSSERVNLKGEFCDEEYLLPHVQEINYLPAVFWIYQAKSILYYSFGEFEKALEYSAKAFPIEQAVMAMPSISALYFQDSLIRTAIVNKTPGKNKEHIKKIESNLKKLKNWAKHAPMNQLHRCELIQAELERISGNAGLAGELYDKSIFHAKETGFLKDEAIANELAGDFYLSLKRDLIAQAYLLEAHRLYRVWGANGKVKFLEELHPEIFNSIKANLSSTISMEQTRTITKAGTYSASRTSAELDMNTTIKASQAIASEIRLENLLKKVIKILIENAGAEKGTLVLRNESDDSLTIQAENSITDREPIVLQSIPINKATSKLPVSIIKYVAKTKANLVLSHASKEGDFTKDAYIFSNQIKSILCFPFIHQGQLSGILYLENNLAVDVFTPDRIQVLNVIVSQVTVSINNALLYASLEDKVNERTVELKESLNKVNRLKNQQDGDYYLTSLLINPLGANKSKSNHVNIEFYIKQKKQFAFKKWQEEIGGDICITHDIYLKNKKMTLFINADAMGKSMQGAGGALVLGSVLKSIIERTLLSPSNQNQYPERWLKYSFIELHKVFESFDGSMLVSVVMGLIEDNTGLMYFINAEHPASVLYRDKKAFFIESSQVLYKLGTQLTVENIITVETFQILPGDVIIHGSDGRDDLILAQDATGSTINQDETLFLKKVEDGKGDLGEIVKCLTKVGEIMDDLSLLRISLKDNSIFPTLQKIDLLNAIPDYESIPDSKRLSRLTEELLQYETAENKNPYVLKILTGEFIKLKDYSLAAKSAELYVDKIPANTQMIYIAAFCSKKAKDFAKAIELSERVRLRKPKYVKNLSNLAESYHRSGNHTRSKEIFNELLLIDPVNQKAIRFLALNS